MRRGNKIKSFTNLKTFIAADKLFKIISQFQLVSHQYDDKQHWLANQLIRLAQSIFFWGRYLFVCRLLPFIGRIRWLVERAL